MSDRRSPDLGVDVSAGCIDLARRLQPELEFRQGDAHRLSLPDASFDAVVANFLMPHLADHPRVAAELTRVLVDEGRVALSTWDQHTLDKGTAQRVVTARPAGHARGLLGTMLPPVMGSMLIP